MRTGEFDINHADGKILLNDIRLDTGVLPRGHKLTKEDILYLKMVGIKKITAGEMGVADLSAENALSNLAPRIVGKNLVYTSPERNLCKIAAEEDGIFVCREDRVDKFNRMSSRVALNTIAPYQNVKKGDVVAELSVFSPALEEDLLEEIDFKLAGNEPLLTLEKLRNEQAAIIYTRFYDDEKENAHFAATVRKMVKNFTPLGLEFAAEYYCPHTVDGIAETVAHAAGRHRMVMIVPGLPASHPDDTAAAALKTIVDDIVCSHIPQTDAHDLMIAVKRSSKIIHIPYNYDGADSPLTDKFIRIAVKKEKITQTDFVESRNILPARSALTKQEQNLLIVPEKNAKDPVVAAVILAAGISSRARRNKLMVKVDGRPLFLKAVEAAVKSKASPVFVITGYDAENMEEYLENLDINVLRNHDYTSGVKTSIRLGLKSVPSSCDGALLIPADMPNLSADYLNRMIKKFAKGKERQLVVTACGGQKYNPVLWSKDLYANADLVPEDSHLRQVFLEHSDYLRQVEADPDLCLDVNFPNDLEKLTKNDDETPPTEPMEYLRRRK